MISDFRDEYFRYDVRLAGTHYLGDTVEKITTEESIDEIALRATIRVAITQDYPFIGPGQTIEIIDTLQNDLVRYDGIIHETNSENAGQKHLDIKAYCRAKYLESEDEVWLGADMTATSRFRLYANKWGIPLGSIADAGQKLDKAVYRPRKLAAMIKADLEETAKKNGRMFRVRSNNRVLDLVELGSNSVIPTLLPEINIEKIQQRRTMLDKNTRVKYVGKQRGGTRKPVYGSAAGEVSQYGTQYRIQIDDRMNTVPEANSASAKQIVPIEEIITVYVSDELINSRAGDKVIIGTMDVSGNIVTGTMELLIINLRREHGNQSSPGHCVLELGNLDYVRRKYYLGDSNYSPSTST